MAECRERRAALSRHSTLDTRHSTLGARHSTISPVTRPAPIPERFRGEFQSAESGLRELMAVREIVHAFLTADRPEEVFQFALDRVSPLVGATFACVYVIEGSSELMRLAAVHNWPQRWAAFLSEMRVRMGFGPSGEAASERRAIEVPDVFADPSLEDWDRPASPRNGHLLLRGKRRGDHRHAQSHAHGGRPDGRHGREGAAHRGPASSERCARGLQRRARAPVRVAARRAPHQGRVSRQHLA